MALADFATDRRHSDEDLAIALAVIKTFKDYESDEEWYGEMFVTWQKLELLQGMLTEMVKHED